MIARGTEGQRGLVLFAVLMIAVIIAVIAAVTAIALKRARQDSGDQRRTFQARHAAEAGVEYFRNRLDQVVLCQPWFGHAESLAVVSVLKNQVVPLPTPYGTRRGFRIQNAKVEPGIMPIGIRFESIGGVIKPDGSLDMTDAVPIVCRLKLTSAAEYLFFNEQGSQYFTSRSGVSTITGKVYGGAGFTLEDDLTFLDDVEYGKEIVYLGDPSTVTFRKGTTNLASSPFNLDNIHVAANDPRPWCGSGPARTYEDLARGAVPNEKRGVWYSGSRDRILINLDEVMLSGNTVNIDFWEFDTLRANSRGPFLGRASIPRSQFNGVVAIDGDVFVKGTLHNVSLTIASTDDIAAVGDVRCSGSESGNDRRVTLGLIAQDKFFIWWHTPTRVQIEAAVIAEDDSLSEKGYGHHYIATLGSWIALGTRTSHPGVDAAGNPASNVGPANWHTTFTGGIVSRRGGGFIVFPPMFPMWDGIYGWPSGHTVAFNFDKDNSYSPPPRFPIPGGKGASRWSVVGVQEK